MKRPIAAGKARDLVVVNVLVDAQSVVAEEHKADAEERQGESELLLRNGADVVELQQEFTAREPDDRDADCGQGERQRWRQVRFQQSAQGCRQRRRVEQNAEALAIDVRCIRDQWVRDDVTDGLAGAIAETIHRLVWFALLPGACSSAVSAACRSAPLLLVVHLIVIDCSRRSGPDVQVEE